VAAILAALDVAAERGRAAALDGRHHLELAEAQMPGIGLAPGGPMAVKDVCDLQPRAAHRRRANLRVSASLGAAVRAGRAGSSLADRADGDAGVERGRVELLVPERTRAIMRTFYVIEIESSVERNSVLANDAALSARDTRPGPLF
jgi:hypothetical protein